MTHMACQQNNNPTTNKYKQKTKPNHFIYTVCAPPLQQINVAYCEVNHAAAQRVVNIPEETATTLDDVETGRCTEAASLLVEADTVGATAAWFPNTVATTEVPGTKSEVTPVAVLSFAIVLRSTLTTGVAMTSAIRSQVQVTVAKANCSGCADSYLSA